MRPGATGDFQFLLKDESLVRRISREMVGAWNEFRRNPRVFISEFVRGEGTNRFRRNALLAGSELALTGLFTLYFLIEALGGGGRQQPTPPSKGAPPQMALTPQIVLPNPEPPKIKNPTLPVAMTTYGDPSLKMPKGPIGDPTGVPAPPSSGPGTGGGIGRSSGGGVGSGAGGGAGPGRGGNMGGGDMGLGGGRSIEPMTASLRPTILYREKAKYTEEARQNKVQGAVMLQVVFHFNLY